jgi:hypothetical protein
MLFSVAVAFGADVDLAAGLDVGVDDPLATPIGVRVDADVGLSRWVGVGASAGIYPPLGSLNRRDLYRASIADFGRTTELADKRWRAALTLEVVPVRNELPNGGFSDVRARVGPVLVGTTDDLRAMGLQDQGDAAATKTQVHPGLLYGLSSSVSRGKVGVRGTIEHAVYAETIASGSVSLENAVFLSVEIGFRP